MEAKRFARLISRSRRLSLLAVLFCLFASIAIVVAIFPHLHIISVLGTIAAALVASTSTWAKSHHRTEKFVRFAIRARLAKKAEPDFERLARSYRDLGKYAQKSAHPSPEVVDALRIAEKQMGLKKGSVLSLVVPLELILGVAHNCPSAAAMLYAGRHPVILIDDSLQALLDSPDNFEKSQALVVSVLSHEISHLLGWNTRWAKVVGIAEMFVATAAMVSIVAFALAEKMTFGIIGAVIACIYLVSEPALVNNRQSSSVLAVAARVALVLWVPFVILGVLLNFLDFSLVLWTCVITFGLKFMLAFLRRKEEMMADKIAAHCLGTVEPLTDFFRSISSHYPNLWDRMFSTHPPVSNRLKALRNLKI